MRNKLRFWTGAAFGAAIQYLYDPKAGQARRSDLRQKITNRVFDAKGVNGRIDHLRLWRTEPRRTASRIV